MLRKQESLHIGIAELVFVTLHL